MMDEMLLFVAGKAVSPHWALNMRLFHINSDCTNNF